MSSSGTDSEQQEAGDNVFPLPTDKAVSPGYGGSSVSPSASADQDDKDGANEPMDTGSPRNGPPPDNRVATEAASQPSDGIDRDGSDALVASRVDDLTAKASSLAVSDQADAADKLTGKPTGASVVGAETPAVDVQAQIAQQNVSMRKDPTWAEQMDSADLLEGFLQRVQRVGGADVSGQARRDGSTSTMPDREEVLMESEQAPEDTKSRKKKKKKKKGRKSAKQSLLESSTTDAPSLLSFERSGVPEAALKARDSSPESVPDTMPTKNPGKKERKPRSGGKKGVNPRIPMVKRASERLLQASRKQLRQAIGTSPPEASTSQQTASPGAGKESKNKAGGGWSTVSHKRPYANGVRKKLEYFSKSWEGSPYFDGEKHALTKDWLHFDRVHTHQSGGLPKSSKKHGKKEPPLTVFGTRLAAARSDRMNNGAIGRLKLAPEVYANWEKHCDPSWEIHKQKLPHRSMSYEDQNLLIKLYALNDGRCPVQGCEPSVLGNGKYTEPPLGSYSIFSADRGGEWRDGCGYLTGVGILDGVGSRDNGQSVCVRPHEKIIQHWAAFHMRQQLTFVWVCPYISDKEKSECHADYKGPIPVFRTIKSFVDHLAGEHANEFTERLVERHADRFSLESAAKVRKTVAEGDDITPGTLKRMIRFELENPADTSDRALVWTGWLHRYRKVAKHESDSYPFLSGDHCGRMFRNFWHYSGPNKLSHSFLMDKATKYVHANIRDKSKWPLYLHGGKGLSETLTLGKRRHESGTEHESDASRRSIHHSDAASDGEPPPPTRQPQSTHDDKRSGAGQPKARKDSDPTMASPTVPTYAGAVKTATRKVPLPTKSEVKPGKKQGPLQVKGPDREPKLQSLGKPVAESPVQKWARLASGGKQMPTSVSESMGGAKPKSGASIHEGLSVSTRQPDGDDVFMDTEDALNASDASLCKQQLVKSRLLYLEELRKQKELSAANALLTEQVRKLEAQVDGTFAATLTTPFSEDTDTRMKELAKENSELRSQCSRATKRAAILAGLEGKNCTLQADIVELREQLNDGLDSYEDLQVKFDSLVLATATADSRHEFESIKLRKTVDKANRELDEAARAYTNVNVENSVLKNRLEEKDKEVKAGRDFVSSLRTNHPGFLAGIDGPRDLPDPSWSGEAKAKDVSKPQGRELFVTRESLNRHDCLESETVWTAKPTKCRYQRLRNWAARTLKESQRLVPDLEIRKEFEQSVKDFEQTVAEGRLRWVVDWAMDEKGIRTSAYSQTAEVPREDRIPVPNALAQTLSKWYEALDELVLGAMDAHGEDAQSFRTMPPQCRARLATAPSKAAKAKKAQLASVPAAESMDTGPGESASVSAGSVDPDPRSTASVSAVDEERTTLKVNTGTGDSSEGTKSSASQDSLDDLSSKIEALCKTVSILVRGADHSGLSVMEGLGHVQETVREIREAQLVHAEATKPPMPNVSTARDNEAWYDPSTGYQLHDERNVQGMRWRSEGTSHVFVPVTRERLDAGQALLAELVHNSGCAIDPSLELPSTGAASNSVSSRPPPGLSQRSGSESVAPQSSTAGFRGINFAALVQAVVGSTVLPGSMASDMTPAGQANLLAASGSDVNPGTSGAVFTPTSVTESSSIPVHTGSVTNADVKREITSPVQCQRQTQSSGATPEFAAPPSGNAVFPLSASNDSEWENLLRTEDVANASQGLLRIPTSSEYLQDRPSGGTGVSSPEAMEEDPNPHASSKEQSADDELD